MVMHMKGCRAYISLSELHDPTRISPVEVDADECVIMAGFGDIAFIASAVIIADLKILSVHIGAKSGAINTDELNDLGFDAMGFYIKKKREEDTI